MDILDGEPAVGVLDRFPAILANLIRTGIKRPFRSAEVS